MGFLPHGAWLLECSCSSFPFQFLTFLFTVHLSHYLPFPISVLGGGISGQGIQGSQVSFKTTSASALSVAKALLLEKSLLPELSLFLLLGGHTLLVYEQPVYYGS